MSKFTDRLKHAWNVFKDKDEPPKYDYQMSISSSRPDRLRLTKGADRSIVTAVYNRIAVDAATIDIEHCRIDENERLMEHIKDDLNYALTVEANKDQTARAFIEDIVLTLCDEGCVAIVPVDVDIDPSKSSSYSIKTLRTGKILEWRPDSILVRVYNDRTGEREDVNVLKKNTAIIENPFYPLMNEPNSIGQRLVQKLALLDQCDAATSSNKLNMIIQLPYVIKSEARRLQAEERLSAIEDQLTNGNHGIAYTDGTERVIQLNRSFENKLLDQIEYLQELYYSQLGITKEIMNGTASPDVMNNYFSRTIEPIMSAIVEELSRKFLSKTSRSQGHSIEFYRKPFKLLSLTDMAGAADSFLRNEILTANEFRQIMGYRPVKDPKADELRNSNMPEDKSRQPAIEDHSSQETDTDKNEQLNNKTQ